MDDIESRNLRDKHTQRRHMLLLCAVALLINVAGDRLVGLLKLPLYLDNIGSALAAALGGYIPGIVVGFFTNLITGLRDYNNTYFGSLTVLIAISSAWFARRGYYDKPWKLPVIAITFALIGAPQELHVLPLCWRGACMGVGSCACPQGSPCRI